MGTLLVPWRVGLSVVHAGMRAMDGCLEAQCQYRGFSPPPLWGKWRVLLDVVKQGVEAMLPVIGEKMWMCTHSMDLCTGDSGSVRAHRARADISDRL